MANRERFRNRIKEFEEALTKRGQERYLLKLYVAGMTSRPTWAAINNLKKVCEEHLQGRYDLEVIDIYQQPTLARGEQIVAAPTLIKRLPPPLKKIIGDLSDTERVLLGLDIREAGGTTPKPRGERGAKEGPKR